MLVADAMTARPVTAPDATVTAARSAMRRRFRHLPVVAGAELVGVVAQSDLEARRARPSRWPSRSANAR